MAYHGLVVSDFHLFRRETSPEARLADIIARVQGKDFLVLNGDMFDFRWTGLPTVAETEDAALDWLKQLARCLEKVRILYVFGNNDCHTAYLGRLRRELAEFTLLQCFPAFAQIDDVFFCHGDIPVFFPFLSPYSRILRRDIKRKSETYQACFETLIQPWLRALTRKIFTPRRSARNIRRAFRNHPVPFSTPIRRVYFGHIHVPFEDLTFGGLRFFNTGAHLPSCQNAWLELEVSRLDINGR
jgi:UDP-2,3-diacylglucosamine hydrolase